MKLLITLFGKGDSMTQHWGTKENPNEYGETKLPARIWNRIAGGELENGTKISAICVEGEATATAR